MKKQEWTNEDTATAIDWTIKMQESVIKHAKSLFIDLTTALELDATNIELAQQVEMQEARIIKLENKLARFIANAPELLEAKAGA